MIAAMPDEVPKPGAPVTVAAEDLGLTVATTEPVAADVANLPVVGPQHYAIEGEVARGGMGRILLRESVELRRKVLPPDHRLLASGHERTVEAPQRLATLYGPGKKLDRADAYRR